MNALIIGGGLGGLFTGAILAKEGLKVTIIEKNATVGGGLQSFTRFGEVFDTGMHVIGGMQRGGNIRRICDFLGIMDKVQIADLDSDFTDELYFAEDGKRYRLAKGREGFVNTLARQFPHQRQELKNYVDAVYRLTNEVDIFFLRPTDSHIPVHSSEFMMAADAFVTKYITDSKLRSVVAYMNPLYSGRADMTPAYVHAIITSLYIDGQSRFVGGSYRFAETLSNFITSQGSTIIKGDGVEHVHSADGLISGVTTKKGHTLYADYYICAIHPCNFMKLLDDPTILPKAYRNRLDSIPNSYSAFTLNLKLKPNSFPYLNHSGYYMTRYDDIWNFGRSDRKWPLGFLYMTPPEEKQGPYSTKMIVTSPMLWDNVQKWENTTVGNRGKDYIVWKQKCAEKLLDQMEQMYPNFRDCVEQINMASPLTIRDYYGVKEGAMCGFSKDYKNILLSQVPVVTKVKNLLLTGQCNNLHGFCGVPLTAINTCEAILGRNYVINKL
ncbi:MAG: NAD(P)/FAD-dependent oxidoreductase [Bacteroidaceae bacterium]|nr:NAD(P)/FAD-dependent oxidoreductase [Bacteroidaceae bacterium]